MKLILLLFFYFFFQIDKSESNTLFNRIEFIQFIDKIAGKSDLIFKLCIIDNSQDSFIKFIYSESDHIDTSKSFGKIISNFKFLSRKFKINNHLIYFIDNKDCKVLPLGFYLENVDKSLCFKLSKNNLNRNIYNEDLKIVKDSFLISDINYPKRKLINFDTFKNK